ncbi:alpha-L-rhamnosidase, partial [Enterococcus faecalis]
VALLPTQMADLAIAPLLEKVLWDFANDQRPDGAMTATAPFVGIMTNGPSNGGGALGWQLVVPELALALVKTYGKQAAVAKLRPQLERHLNYLLAF